VELPEAFVPAGGHVGEVERRRAAASQATADEAQAAPVVEVAVPQLPLPVREAAREQPVPEIGLRRDAERPFQVEARTGAAPGAEELVQLRRVDDAGEESVAVLQSDRHAVHRVAVDVVRRAVERVHDPAVGGRSRLDAPLLPEDPVVGPGGADPLDHAPFDREVELRHEVAPALVADLLPADGPETRMEPRPGLTREVEGEVEESVHGSPSRAPRPPAAPPLPRVPGVPAGGRDPSHSRVENGRVERLE